VVVLLVQYLDDGYLSHVGFECMGLFFFVLCVW
jgi:hypothetical protein